MNEDRKLLRFFRMTQLSRYLVIALLGAVLLILGVMIPNNQWSAPSNATRLNPLPFDSEFEAVPRVVWNSADIRRNPNRVDFGFNLVVTSDKRLKEKASLLSTSIQNNRNLQLYLDQRGTVVLRIPTLVNNTWKPVEVLVKEDLRKNELMRIDVSFDDTRSFFSVKLNGEFLKIEKTLTGEIISEDSTAPLFDFIKLGTPAAKLGLKITEIGVAIGPIPFQLDLQYLKLFLLVLSLLFFYPIINLILHSKRLRNYIDRIQLLYTRENVVVIIVCVLLALFIPGELKRTIEQEITQKSRISEISESKEFQMVIEYQTITKPISNYATVISLGQEFYSGIALTFDQYGSQFLVFGSRVPIGSPLQKHQLLPMNNSDLGLHQIVISYKQKTLEVVFDNTKVDLKDAVTGTPLNIQNLDFESLAPIQLFPQNEFGASSKVESLRLKLPAPISLLGPVFRSVVILGILIGLAIFNAYRRSRGTVTPRSND
jgi:hypothetical protein